MDCTLKRFAPEYDADGVAKRQKSQQQEGGSRLESIAAADAAQAREQTATAAGIAHEAAMGTQQQAVKQEPGTALGHVPRQQGQKALCM